MAYVDKLQDRSLAPSFLRPDQVSIRALCFFSQAQTDSPMSIITTPLGRGVAAETVARAPTMQAKEKRECMFVCGLEPQAQAD